MATEAPAWFEAAVARTATRHRVAVDDCPIHYRRWGEAGRPGLLLVHGYSANSHWWDFIAPAFADDHLVVALDCSGAGDSGHRDRYDLDIFSREILAVADAAGLGEDLVLVGHSFGGGIALRTAARYPERVKALVSVDAKLVPLPGEHRPRATRGFLPHSCYPDEESAVAAYRVIPPQRCANGYLLDHIARHSVHATPEGWQLKADPALLDRFRFEDQTDALLGLATGFGMIHGALSASVTEEDLAYLRYVAPPGSPFHTIPGAAHHVFLDEPLAFIDTLRDLLAHWS